MDVNYSQLRLVSLVFDLARVADIIPEDVYTVFTQQIQVNEELRSTAVTMARIAQAMKSASGATRSEMNQRLDSLFIKTRGLQAKLEQLIVEGAAIRERILLLSK
jgi:hypothetical protein